jgi:hypothetical protein
VEVALVQGLAKQVVLEQFQHLSGAPPLMVLAVRVADGQIVLVQQVAMAPETEEAARVLEVPLDKFPVGLVELARYWFAT